MLQNINQQAKINYSLTALLVSIVLMVTFCESDYYKDKQKPQYALRKNNTAEIVVKTQVLNSSPNKELLIIEKKFYANGKLIRNSRSVDTLAALGKQEVKDETNFTDYEIYVDVKNSMSK